jgi:uncharacterized protein
VAGGFFVGIMLAAIFVTVVAAVTGDEESPAVFVAAFTGQWIAWAGAAWLASRVAGTRSFADDLGWRFERADVLRGAGVAAAGLVAALVVQSLLSAINENYVGSNTGFVEDQAGSLVGAIAVGVSTLIGAPILEELFFRGLLQRALARLRSAAVIVQALIFGLVHTTPGEGLGNIGIVLGLATFGSVLGLAVRHWGRLGPAIIGHAMFNALAVVPILLSS